MIVTFCGHKDDIYKKDTEEKLYEILEELIKKGANEFLLGGYGSFEYTWICKEKRKRDYKFGETDDLYTCVKIIKK